METEKQPNVNDVPDYGAEYEDGMREAERDLSFDDEIDFDDDNDLPDYYLCNSCGYSSPPQTEEGSKG